MQKPSKDLVVKELDNGEIGGKRREDQVILYFKVREGGNLRRIHDTMKELEMQKKEGGISRTTEATGLKKRPKIHLL